MRGVGEVRKGEGRGQREREKRDKLRKEGKEYKAEMIKRGPCY